MDRNDLIKRILEEEDYIKSPKFMNSLTKFVNKNSDGVENSVIARLLMISEEEVNQLYQEAVETLRAGATQEE